MDIRQLTFKRFSKALYRLVVAWRSRAWHTFSKPVLFCQLLCFLCCILASSVAVVYSTGRSVRISAYRHFESLLHDLLPLVLCYIPTDQSPCCHIDHPTDIDTLVVTFQLRYVRTPQVIRICYSKLVLDQILFYVLFLCRLWSLCFSGSAACGCSIRFSTPEWFGIPYLCRILTTLLLRSLTVFVFFLILSFYLLLFKNPVGNLFLSKSEDVIGNK